MTTSTCRRRWPPSSTSCATSIAGSTARTLSTADAGRALAALRDLDQVLGVLPATDEDLDAEPAGTARRARSRPGPPRLGRLRSPSRRACRRGASRSRTPATASAGAAAWRPAVADRPPRRRPSRRASARVVRRPASGGPRRRGAAGGPDHRRPGERRAARHGWAGRGIGPDSAGGRRRARGRSGESAARSRPAAVTRPPGPAAPDRVGPRSRPRAPVGEGDPGYGRDRSAASAGGGRPRRPRPTGAARRDRDRRPDRPRATPTGP